MLTFCFLSTGFATVTCRGSFGVPAAPAWLAPRKALPPLPPPNPAAAPIWFPLASGIASNAYMTTDPAKGVREGERAREGKIGKREREREFGIRNSLIATAS